MRAAELCRARHNGAADKHPRGCAVSRGLIMRVKSAASVRKM